MYYTRVTIWLQEFELIKNKINVMDRMLTMFFFYVIIIHILFYRSEQEYEENF